MNNEENYEPIIFINEDGKLDAEVFRVTEYFHYLDIETKIKLLDHLKDWISYQMLKINIEKYK